MCYAQYKQEGITENSVLDLAKFCEEDRPTNTLKLNGDSSSVNSSLIYEKKKSDFSAVGTAYFLEVLCWI